jgi:hypothetical protein
VVEPVSVGVFVAGLLAKALDRAEGGVVDGAVKAARKATQALRERFSREGDDEAERALESLAEAPDSKRREQALGDLLEERAARSAELREELQAIAAEIEGAGTAIGTVKQVARGDRNVQIGGVVGSDIKVNQRERQPRD